MNTSATVTRYVDEATCRNSLIVSSIASVISLTLAAALFKRAFAEQLGSQFMASDSAIHYMTIRNRCLFLSALLCFADAISNVIQWAILLQGEKLVDFVLVRIVFMLSLVIALPLQTYATCQRCALIVARDPVKRTRLLKTAFRTCVASLVAMEAGVAYTLITMVAAGSKTTTLDWLTVIYMPPPVVTFMASMPLLIMFSSVWALWANFSYGHHPNSASVTSGSTVLSDGSARHQSTSKVASIAGQAPGTQPQPTRPTVSPVSSIIASVKTPGATAANLAHKLRSRSKSLLDRAGASHHSASRSQLTYPLSTSFTILTVGIVVLWSLGLTATLFPIFPNIRRSPINAIFTSVCLALEASFERLLKFAKQKHHSRHSRQAIVTAAFQGDDDNATNLAPHGMSVSGIGSWTAGTRLGHGRGDQAAQSLQLEPAVKEEDLESGPASNKGQAQDNIDGVLRDAVAVTAIM